MDTNGSDENGGGGVLKGDKGKSAETEFDTDIYGSSDKFAGYVTSIAATDEPEDDDDDFGPSGVLGGGGGKGGGGGAGGKTFTAPGYLMQEAAETGKDMDPFADSRPAKIIDREDEYRQKRRQRIISPERHDPFADGGKTPDIKALSKVRTFVDVMREQALSEKEKELKADMVEKGKAGELKVSVSRRDIDRMTNRSTDTLTGTHSHTH